MIMFTRIVAIVLPWICKYRIYWDARLAPAIPQAATCWHMLAGVRPLVFADRENSYDVEGHKCGSDEADDLQR